MKKSGISSRIVWTLVLLSVIWVAELGCMLWAGSQAAMIVGGVGLLATAAAAFALHAGVRKAFARPLNALAQAADSLAKGEPVEEIADFGTENEIGRAVYIRRRRRRSATPSRRGTSCTGPTGLP